MSLLTVPGVKPKGKASKAVILDTKKLQVEIHRKVLKSSDTRLEFDEHHEDPEACPQGHGNGLE